MTDFYSTADKVKARTGITFKDLGVADDAALTALIEDLLTEISDLVNRRIRRNYLQELDDGDIDAIPAGLSGIVADIAVNAIGYLVTTRETRVIRVDDFAVRQITPRLFTADIVERLKLYGHSVASVDLDGDLAGVTVFDPDLGF